MRRFEPAVIRSDREARDGAPGGVRVVRLATPPVARLVPDGVFDDFGWCASVDLEWRRPEHRWDGQAPVDGSDPARMVFVFQAHLGSAERAPWPRELARLHTGGLPMEDGAEALAPWAIDHATDAFHARRLRPGDYLWLAADNLNALFWGLHDWAHFHHHGPFEQVAWTELQCDASALAWLWINRAQVPVDAPSWERLRDQVVALTRARFAAERAVLAGPDPRDLLGPARLQSLLLPARTSQS